MVAEYGAFDWRILIFVPEDQPDVVWSKHEMILQSVPFSVLSADLPRAFDDALLTLNRWSPDIIRQTGTSAENLRHQFGREGGN